MLQEITLSDEQNAALQNIYEWFSNTDRQQFALAGYAGTGKSTVVDKLIRKIEEESGEPKIIRIVAPTGKAAQVLRSKGVHSADTVHSFLYSFDGKSYDEEKDRDILHFRPKDNTDDWEVDLLIVDEASMVNMEMYQDLVDTGVRILWIGDHGQLPPVGADPCIMRNADIKLETIHRQAKGNPIIEVADGVRRGEHPLNLTSLNDPERLWIGRKKDISSIGEWSQSKGPDRAPQIIVPFHRIRTKINESVRAVRGFQNQPVAVGERLICTANNRNAGIYNGMIFQVIGVAEETDINGHVCGNVITIVSEDPSDTRKWRVPAYIDTVCDVHRNAEGRHNWDSVYDSTIQNGIKKKTFTEDDENFGKVRVCGASRFDYGYAITCHKAQGSQWPVVMVVDRPCRNFDEKRWRYTAYTRASERLIVATD